MVFIPLPEEIHTPEPRDIVVSYHIRGLSYMYIVPLFTFCDILCFIHCWRCEINMFKLELEHAPSVLEGKLHHIIN